MQHPAWKCHPWAISPAAHADTFNEVSICRERVSAVRIPGSAARPDGHMAAPVCRRRWESQGHCFQTATQKSAGDERCVPPHQGPEILQHVVGRVEHRSETSSPKARARRKEGALPFIFVDEAESVLGTTDGRCGSFNINNTLVPMFCAEMDGIESLQDVVIDILASTGGFWSIRGAADGRIDRKDQSGASTRGPLWRFCPCISLPRCSSPRCWATRSSHDKARRAVGRWSTVFLANRPEPCPVPTFAQRRAEQGAHIAGILSSGAILSAIVQRAKEKAIERAGGRPARAAMATAFRRRISLIPCRRNIEGECCPLTMRGGRMVEAPGPSSRAGGGRVFVPPGQADGRTFGQSDYLIGGNAFFAVFFSRVTDLFWH